MANKLLRDNRRPACSASKLRDGPQSHPATYSFDGSHILDSALVPALLATLLAAYNKVAVSREFKAHSE